MGNTKKAAKEKPLEKMTAKELRELAKDIPEMSGVHGMNKPELISAIKKSRGIEDTGGKKSDASVRDTKKKIKKDKIYLSFKHAGTGLHSGDGDDILIEFFQ